MDIAYTIIKRNIKNPRLEFKHGDLFVIVPTRGNFDVEAFVARHAAWIKKHAGYFERIKNTASALLLEPRLAADFEAVVMRYIDEGFLQYGVRPHMVRFKTMRSRWGSCTNTGIITINLKLRYFSDEMIAYVVFHEIVHLLARRHDRKFYVLLSQRFPQYKKLDQTLVAYEYLLSSQNKPNFVY